MLLSFRFLATWLRYGHFKFCLGLTQFTSLEYNLYCEYESRTQEYLSKNLSPLNCLFLSDFSHFWIFIFKVRDRLLLN